MLIDFDEILRDLELKRAAALPAADRPRIDLAAALHGLPEPSVRVRRPDGSGDEALSTARIGGLAADALVTLALAAGTTADVDRPAARTLVRRVTADVLDRLAALSPAARDAGEERAIDLLAPAPAGAPTVVGPADPSILVEAAFIGAGAYDAAKALVIGRAAAPGRVSGAGSDTTSRTDGPGRTVGLADAGGSGRPDGPAGGAAPDRGAADVGDARPAGGASSTAAGREVGLRLIRRSGDVVAWDAAKIEDAVRRAFLSLHADPAPATTIAARVSERAAGLGLAYVPIETVQDVVQEELVLAGQMRVAERFIVYRAERAILRARGELGTPDAGGQLAALSVVEDDGSESFWDGHDLTERIRFAAIGLNLDLDHHQLDVELRRSVTAGISRADLRRLVVLNAKSLVERDSDLSRFAARILLTYVYEETLDWRIDREGVAGLQAAHARALRPALQHGVAIGRISPALLDYDLDRLAAKLDPTADLDFDFLGIQTLFDRYLTVDKTGERPRRIEAPQLFWMRVAMGVCLAEQEDERVDRALALYGIYKDRRFCSSTPTLFNAGTPHSQLSSCYLYTVQDTLESIVQRGIADNAMCSKWAGGLGGSWTQVRGTGSFINGTNGESQGVVPFLKLHNDQLVAVNQGGKRAGSGCAYLEVWHNDIRDFLELRKNTGDERRRTHDMNTASWIPDLFMKRVEARETWTLFRSSDVPDLHEHYGQAFEARYLAHEERAKRGEIHGESIPAIELWKLMLKALFETGHPWITFKDPCNVRSPQDHAGVVHSSNLCTEITLNTSVEETAVCNLGSIVIDQHLTADGEIDHEKLRETVRIAVRALDDVIDVNFYPTAAARTANDRHRPVGLGVMGLQYALYRKGIAFGSDAAVEFSDEMMEAIAFHAYEASSDLAAERGTYQSYAGSKWDRGLLPQDTVDLLEQERGLEIPVPRGGRLDWTPVREKIARQGMRNSNVLAIAPTATIANIVGTSPCIEPMYKNLFAKSNLSGDFTILNPYLVRDLKAAGLWTEEVAGRIKFHDGDLTEVPVIPAEIVERYRTAFQIPTEYLIDAAARRQKWIDQSQSLNLFLASPDMKAMSHMYRRAWRMGLKTTYYLRTLGASSIEKSSVVAAADATPPVAVEAPVAAVAAAPASGPVAGPDSPAFPGVPRFDTSGVAAASAPTTDPVEDAGADIRLDPAACSIEAMLGGGECEACQ
ncbi:ribonucleoside-diphosphate reductase subunit alpha [Patulibacter sp. NPDC049589]|uniref:ribonucleoside-diphosphate reductase subunit alpha n=1 Tax=Patulibacter sp. NPDC049589 TaxID=3154731 RepID=UPI00343DF485